MAIPALPADDSAGNTWTAAKVNAVYDLLQLFRDTRPLFKGVGQVLTPATATTVEFGHGAVSATFDTSPTINIGGWTVAAGANGDGGYNIVIPESGIYEGVWHMQHAAHATGDRTYTPQHNSSAISQSIHIINPQDTLGTTAFVHFVVDTAASDTLSIDVLQDSGTSLSTTASLFVKWVQST